MQKFLLFSIRQLKRVLNFLEQRSSLQTKSFQRFTNSLAPKIITDKKELSKIDPYLNSLKDALESDGINNIAITGSYGSGKSTIESQEKTTRNEY